MICFDKPCYEKLLCLVAAQRLQDRKILDRLHAFDHNCHFQDTDHRQICLEKSVLRLPPAILPVNERSISGKFMSGPWSED